MQRAGPAATPRPPGCGCWRSPGKRRLPAHVLLLQLPKSPQPRGSPAPPSRPAEGKLLPTPLISWPFLRAGQEGAARPPPAPPYLLPGPLPPALPGSRLPLQDPPVPRGVTATRSPPSPAPESSRAAWLRPCPPFPLPSRSGLFAFFMEKRFYYRPLAAHLYSGNWSGVNFGVAGSRWRAGDAAPIGCSSRTNRRDSPGYQELCRLGTYQGWSWRKGKLGAA